jgi:oligoribonuclease NrnB/cAMP/cGMP phosphodiesterase (DHH superfamily)
MAYDAGINEIWDTMDQMDQNIRSQSERGLITDQRELTELTVSDSKKYTLNTMEKRLFFLPMFVVNDLCDHKKHNRKNRILDNAEILKLAIF